MDKWEATREQYGCKEVPIIKLSLMDGNETLYTMILDTLTTHKMIFGSKYKRLRFSTALINDTDYAMLVSKKYEKYVIETQQYWRNAEDGQDYLIELPAQIFHIFDIEYGTHADGSDPAKWHFTFEEWEEDDN